MSPILKIGGLALIGAGVITGLVFLIIALAGGGGGAGTTPTPSATQTTPPTPIASGDMSSGLEDLQLPQKSVNDPYVHGQKIVYTTSESGSRPGLIAVYDLDAQEGEDNPVVVSGINKEYDDLFEPKINDDYIVYLDCKEEDGGKICGFDRASGEQFTIREYVLGKPKVSLSGKYALWMQNVLGNTDKLYLYDLEAREAATIEVFVNTPFSVSAPYMSDSGIIFTQAAGESEILQGSSAVQETQLCIIPLTESGDMKQRILFDPGMYAYDPMTDGEHIIFLDSNRDENTQLMLCTKEGDTFSKPVPIAEGVLNYRMGNGYVAYTKDDAVYVYYYADGSVGRLSPENMKALLQSVDGKDVIWYDITDFGEVADVVIHITVP